MKTHLALTLLSLAACCAASAKGLYYVPNDTEESVPIQWSVGLTGIYDSNTNPGGVFDGEESFSLNPYVGLSFVSVTPQTTWNVYARLGAIFYLDKPAGLSQDVYGQANVGINLTHRFSERLRLVSNSYLSYELEPDYSYGFATTRQLGEYFYYQTDNALGYRWTERFATYTGIQFNGIDYQDVSSSNRYTWTAYNQFRYQVSPQAVLTASYRYSQTDANGVASDSTNQYALVGMEYRFSPTTIGVMNVGAQFREVDGPFGDNSTNPYVEFNLNSQVNQQFNVRTFLRYGAEDYDTVFGAAPLQFQYDNRLVLRVGASGSYELSPVLSFFGGIDLIYSDYEKGEFIGTPVGVPSADETLFNIYVGATYNFNETFSGSLSYSYTDSTADAPITGRDYNRSRVSLGVTAEF